MAGFLSLLLLLIQPVIMLSDVIQRCRGICQGVKFALKTDFLPLCGMGREDLSGFLQCTAQFFVLCAGKR